MNRARAIVTLPSVIADSDTILLRDQMTTAPTYTRLTHIDRLIRSLKTAGVWSKMDVLWVLAAHDAQAARLNWKAPSTLALSETSAPTFTADQGYAGNGTSSYLTSTYNPATFGGQFALNSAHIAVWSRTDVTSATAYDIGNTNAQLNSRASSANAPRGPVNNGSFQNYGSDTPSSVGHHLLTRVDSNTVRGYRNGVQLGQVGGASASITSAAITIGAVGANYSTRQIAVAHAGSALTDAEVAAAYGAIQTYLAAIGAA